MSPPDDRDRDASKSPAGGKSKPGERRPGTSGAGRSASARSIGEELGGLDFEPDALLDSLLAEEPPPAKPPPAKPEPKPEPEPLARAKTDENLPQESLGPKLLEPEQRLYAEDETTVARSLDVRRVIADDAVDELLAESGAVEPAPGPLPKPSIPRPGASRAGAPRPVAPDFPIVKMPSLVDEDRTLDGPRISQIEDPTFTEELDPDEIQELADISGRRDAEVVSDDDAEELPPELADELAAADAFPSERTAVLNDDEFSELGPSAMMNESDAEIDALVGSLSDLPPPPSAPAPLVEAPALPKLYVEEPPESEQSLALEEERLSELEADGWADQLADERPAAAHLSEQKALDSWLERAAWLEQEAATAADPGAKARALLVASELWAMGGDLARARKVAQAAQLAAPALALAGRQTRILAAADKDWKTVSAALEVESKASPTPETRAHALYLGAEVLRVVNGEQRASDKKLEAMAKALPSDPRPYVFRLAQELAQSDKPPKLALPAEVPDIQPLATAVSDIARLRGADDGPSGSGLLALPFEEARRALAAGDRARAGNAIAELARLDGFEKAALWLGAALLAPSHATRPRAIELLQRLLQQTGSSAAKKALAARALEQGDASAVEAALGALEESSFTPADRVALAALTGGDGRAIAPFLGALESDPRLAPLAAAAASCTRPPDAPAELVAGEQSNRAKVVLGRAVVAAQAERADVSLLRSAFEGFAIAHPGHPLGQVLEIELALRGGATVRVASALAEWASTDEESAAERNRHLAAALLYEIAKDGDKASREYAAALRADPSTEPAVRALMSSTSVTGTADLLSGLAESVSDDVHKALLLLEAALRLGFEADQFGGLLERAATLAPSLPFAFRFGKQHARFRGDAQDLIRWLRRRREAVDDPVEKALDYVREALVVADSDLGAAAELLSNAVSARPNDVSLRELYERLSPAASTSRGEWREQVAANMEGPGRIRLLLEAALEYERADDRESAARAASAASEIGDGVFAHITAERLAAFGPGAGKLAEALLDKARAATDPRDQSELYGRLSTLDRARGDTSSAMLWQTAIIESNPKDLRALRHVEHAFISEGRADELEPSAAALASALDRNEGTAHAILAARIRARTGNMPGVRELAEIAAKFDPPPLWALRTLSVHARDAHDDETLLSVEKQLSERANRAIDAATLALRAAEAALRLERYDESKHLLDRAVEMVPEHLVALATLAEVLDRAGSYAAAAETLEAVATSSAVEAHRLEAWHRAALLWLDKADDAERGQHALERASEIELTHGDVFERLRALYVSREERAKLAELLERRLAATDDPDERVSLEVTRGRALAEVGDKTAAKQALAAALDANPDHSDALDAFAEICVAEGDWEGAEQSWIRLARHAIEPEKQAEMYRKLGRLYDEHLPNRERAELAYKEVLKRLPNDLGAMQRLVQLYGRAGEAQKALDLQTDLLNKASTADEKRDRTIELALVQEQILNDRRKAEATLDKARKSWPQDGVVLRALADFYRRSGESKALNMLLDRAANDSRRALATGRFDAALFESLATVAELRDDMDAARVAKSTIASLHGESTPIPGGGPRAGDAKLDDLVAPELLSLPLRALLKKSGDALDVAYHMDLRSLRAAPLPADASRFAALVQQLASGYGLTNVDISVSSSLPMVCLPVSSVPPHMVIGTSLLEKEVDEEARAFLILRCLKIIQARASTLSRTAPIEQWPLMAAFLSVFATNWQPPGIDPKRLADAQQKIRNALSRRIDDDVPVLALEVIGALGNRASQLGTAVNQWGNRTALLALGDPTVALRGVALAGSQGGGPPTDAAERLKWIIRNPEARDVAVFSVSEQYAEARRRLGVAE